MSKQNELRQEQITNERKERENQLNAVLAEALSARETALMNYRTQLKNLQHAKDAEDILTKSYETGIIDFNDILDLQELQLKFEKAISGSNSSKTIHMTFRFFIIFSFFYLYSQILLKN